MKQDRGTIRGISLLLWCFWIPVSVVTSQAYVNQIGNPRTYQEFKSKVNEYYAAHDHGKGTGYTQYVRSTFIDDGRYGQDSRARNFQALNQMAYSLVKADVSNDRSTHGDWESLGPYDVYSSDSYSGANLGRTNCIAYHPSNPDIMWVGTPAGGLWKTIDGGLTWNCITNYFSSIGVTAVVVDYTNPDILYILTGDGDSAPSGFGGDANSIGVLKTTNGGLSWQPTGLTFGANDIMSGYTLKMHPTNPSILLAGFIDLGNTSTTTTLFKTTSGGDTWSSVLMDITVWDIEFKPGDPSIVYASSSAGLFKSIDTGSSFGLAGVGLPTIFNRVSIAISPSQPGNLYALVSTVTTTTGFFGGVFKSTDSGATFTIQSNTPNIIGGDIAGNDNISNGWWNLAFIVDPANDNQIFVGGVNCWKSTNGGVTWSRETWWTRVFGGVDPYVHADFHGLSFNGASLFANTDGGIFKTNDFGNSWSDYSKGIGVMQFYHIDVLNSHYIGGTQDNGSNEGSVGNTQFHNIHGADGFGACWHNGDQTIEFLSSQGDIVRRQFGSNLLIFQAANSFWYTELTMSTNTNHLFLTTGPNQTSNNLVRGHQNVFPHDWTFEDTGASVLIGGNRIMGYAQGVDNPNIMYVVSINKIIKTENIHTNPSTWVEMPNPAPTVPIQNVEVDPANADRVWIVCGSYMAGQKVFQSEDGGDTWTNISGGLPNVPVRCLAYGAVGSDEIYIGSEIGVFFKRPGIDDWVYFGNNLPNNIITELKISEGYLYAATYGRGIWRSAVYTPCETNLILTQANDPNTIYYHGTQLYHASNMITNSRIVPGSLGTSANYTAGNAIDFVDGFWGQTNAFIEAKIGGCPD